MSTVDLRPSMKYDVTLRECATSAVRIAGSNTTNLMSRSCNDCAAARQVCQDAFHSLNTSEWDRNTEFFGLIWR